jgi:ArsR family transcriptional regulator
MGKTVSTGIAAELAEIHDNLSDEISLSLTADLFKVLADTSRLKIINALMLSELSVGDLAAVTDMPQPTVSYHLKNLRQSRLVKHRRDGQTIYYSLDDEHVRNIFDYGLSHVGEQ